jgi:hypothetical protein
LLEKFSKRLDDTSSCENSKKNGREIWNEYFAYCFRLEIGLVLTYLEPSSTTPTAGSIVQTAEIVSRRIAVVVERGRKTTISTVEIAAVVVSVVEAGSYIVGCEIHGIGVAEVVAGVAEIVATIVAVKRALIQIATTKVIAAIIKIISFWGTTAVEGHIRILAALVNIISELL